MINVMYYFNDAVENAQKTINRLGQARYIILTALGYQIVSQRPSVPIQYKAWQVFKSGVRLLTLTAVLWYSHGRLLSVSWDVFGHAHGRVVEEVC